MPSDENKQLFAHRCAREIFNYHDTAILTGAGLDDSAFVQLQNETIVVSSDLKSARNFSQDFLGANLNELGALSVRQNVSDILASGAMPKWYILSVALPDEISKCSIRSLFTMVRQECDRFGTAVIGGDTKHDERLVLCGTVIGLATGPIWKISNASPNMALYVSTPLGAVTAALVALEKLSETALASEARDVLSAADINKEMLFRLIEGKHPLAATDISDGLGYSLHRFMQEGKVSIRVRKSGIPVHPFAQAVAEAIGVQPLSFAFGYGGDFAFLFGAHENDRKAVEESGAFHIGDIVGGLEASSENDQDYLTNDEIPNFGFLDFEQLSDVDRFLEFSYGFCR